MKKFKLYALTEPNNVETIKYIGITQQVLLVRLGQHLSKIHERKTRRDEWILKMEIAPRIIVLDSFETYKEAYKAETDIITEYELKGITLYNEQKNYNRRWKEMKPVYQYTREGKYIKSYKSAKEAAILNLFFSYKNINACCTGSKKTHHNFMFSFEKKESIEPFDRSTRCGAKEVHQYTIEGVYINSYPSAVKAGKELGLKYTSGINCCCTNYKGTTKAYGFKWSYDKV